MFRLACFFAGCLALTTPLRGADRERPGQYRAFWLTSTAGKDQRAAHVQERLVLLRLSWSGMRQRCRLSLDTGRSAVRPPDPTGVDRDGETPLLDSLGLFFETYQRRCILNQDGVPLKRVEPVTHYDQAEQTVLLLAEQLGGR